MEWMIEHRKCHKVVDHLFREMLHDGVDEADGLQGLPEAHAVREDGAAGHFAFQNIL